MGFLKTRAWGGPGGPVRLSGLPRSTVDAPEEHSQRGFRRLLGSPCRPRWVDSSSRGRGMGRKHPSWARGRGRGRGGDRGRGQHDGAHGNGTQPPGNCPTRRRSDFVRACELGVPAGGPASVPSGQLSVRWARQLRSVRWFSVTVPPGAGLPWRGLGDGRRHFGGVATPQMWGERPGSRRTQDGPPGGRVSWPTGSAGPLPRSPAYIPEFCLNRGTCVGV